MISFLATLAIVLSLVLVLLGKRNGELRDATVKLHQSKARALNDGAVIERLRDFAQIRARRIDELEDQLRAQHRRNKDLAAELEEWRRRDLAPGPNYREFLVDLEANDVLEFPEPAPAMVHHMKRQGHDIVDLSERAQTERDERLAEAKLSMDCAVAHPAGCDCRATYHLFRRLARLPPAEAVSA